MGRILFSAYLISLTVVVGLLSVSYLAFADTASTSVTISNSAPTVTNVTISPDPITLIESAAANILMNADITDANGCSDVYASGSVSAVLFRTGVGSSCVADDQNCYRSISMGTVGSPNPCAGGSDTSFTASATVSVQWFAQATDASSSHPTEWWAAWVQATDGAGATSTATSSTAVELVTLIALNETAAINYATVAAGDNTGTSNQTAVTTNTGNATMNLEISGTDLTGAGTIAAANQRYGTSSPAYASLAYSLSTSPATVTLGLTSATTSTAPALAHTYWGVQVPLGSPQGAYTGTNTFTAAWAAWQDPQYWVTVPGNSTYSTSDFSVMAYEAKCVRVSDDVALTAPDTGYQTYSNSGQPCTGSSYRIASVPDGYPIANISHATAVSYCAALGAHLITNAEWMTITRNAEQVATNWTLGAVGSGALFRGNSNTSLAMPAGDPLSGINTRTLALSNGATVWDLPGNVWEHVRRDASDTLTSLDDEPDAAGSSGWNWYTINGDDGLGANRTITDWGGLAYADVGPSNTSWNANQGMGRIYSYSGSSGNTTPTYVFLRGGVWV